MKEPLRILVSALAGPFFVLGFVGAITFTGFWNGVKAGFRMIDGLGNLD